jgi:hypothetical protein
VQALFQDAAPAHASFGNDDILTATAQTATIAAGGIFATGATGATEDGASVADDGRLAVGGGSEVRLWLRLELAATSSLSGAQANFATVFVNAL